MNGNLEINGEQIEQVSAYKLLGIILDECLSFENHVVKLCHKLNQIRFLIRKLAKVLPVHCLRNLYYAYVHSRLSYGISVWGGLISSMNFNALVKMQKSFVRIINYKPFNEASSPLFLRNKILKLADVVKLELILLMFQFQSEKLPNSIRKLFVERDHNYQTRNKYLPSVNRHHTTMFNKSFMNQAPKVWQEHKYLFENVSTRLNIKKYFKYHCFEKY